MLSRLWRKLVLYYYNLKRHKTLEKKIPVASSFLSKVAGFLLKRFFLKKEFGAQFQTTFFRKTIAGAPTQPPVVCLKWGKLTIETLIRV